MPFVTANGTRLHFKTHGSGPTLMLIHGLGSSGEDWAFQVAELQSRFRLVVPDLRGSGLSDKPPGPYSIAGFADDLWHLADQLGERRIHLAGFSLGGAVALEMALARPERVDRLVMINALPSYRVDHWKKWIEAHGQLTLVRLLGLRRTARMLGRRLFPLPHQRAMRERVVSVIGSNPSGPYLATVRALIGWCAQARLRELRCPSMLLSAELDYTGLEEKRGWAERMGADFLLVRGSRHGTPFDAIRATNASLSAFLLNQPPPPEHQLTIDPPERVPTAPPAL